MVIVTRSATIGIESLLQKTDAFDTFQGKWEPGGDVPLIGFESLKECQTVVYDNLELLPCKGLTVDGIMPGIFAFDVENRRRQKRNSSVGKLLQLLQFFRDLSVVNAFNLFESAVLKNVKYCICQALYQILLEKLCVSFLSSAVGVSFLFEYLMGYIERGGWATYSDTSWEFRATYVSIELRLAAYFWFKFRAWPPQPSSSEGGRKRRRAELKGWPSVSHRIEREKFEPRLSAKIQNGNNRMVPVYLGEYDSRQEAVVVYWIGAYYYNRWDRFSNGAPPRCMVINLPPLPPNLSVEDKNTWVQRQAEVSLTTWRRHQDRRPFVEHCQARPIVRMMLSAAVEAESQEVLDAEPHQGAMHVGPVITPMVVEGRGLHPSDLLRSSPLPCEVIEARYVDQETIPRAVEGEGLDPIHDLMQSLPPPCADTQFMLDEIERSGLQQPDSTEVFGQGGGSEGLNLPRTYQISNSCQQQDIQNLQQSRGNAIDWEGGGAATEVEAMSQDETDLAPKESTDHTNDTDLPTHAREQLNELRFTDEIRSTFRELREQGLGFEMQPLDSNETFHVDYSEIASRKRPRLTDSNFFALEEFHKQGYKVILKPLSDATTQDATGRLRSGSSSEGLCVSCNARLSEIAE